MICKNENLRDKTTNESYPLGANWTKNRTIPGVKSIKVSNDREDHINTWEFANRYNKLNLSSR